MNSTILRKTLLFLSIALLTNCIAYTSDLLQKPAPIDATKVTAKPKVFLKTSFRVISNGNNIGVNPHFQSNWQAAIENKIQNIGLFELTKNEFATDYILSVEVEDSGEANSALAILTGLTLFVFPSTANDHFKLTLNILDSNEVKIGTVIKEEKVVLWQQIFLIFALPFYYFPSVVKQTQDDLVTAIFAEAFHQGYFSKSKPKKK